MTMQPELRNRIDEVAARYPSRRSALLPALRLAQRALGGHVPRDVVAEIATQVGVPVSTAFGVQSYYSMFNLRPVGRYHLQVDTNVPAMLSGADAIVAHLERTLGVKVGGTTVDGLFTLSEVEDLASCGTCPVIQVNDRYYENMTPERVDALLASLRAGTMPDWPPESSWGSECRVLLRHRDSLAAQDIDVYERDGGYGALRKALGMRREEVVAAVADANVRGRGGAGFPMGTKWGFLPRERTGPVYLICNADEGEPGTFKDRQIMEHDPHLLVEAMTIAGYAIGAELGFVYLRGELAWLGDVLDRAILQARAKGLLGRRILGTDATFDLVVHLGAGSYVCGEETALIESLEGKRGNPRLKPPFPAGVGLYGAPTIVNNVETLACVPYIIENGAAAFRAMGTTNNFGPKIFGVSGHVNRPGVYEYPLGTPLETVLQAAGGVKGKLKAVVVGGLSVPILTAGEAEGLALDYDACLKRGTSLGSGGIVVMNETTSIPRVALRAMRFYAHESCGQCTPCRQGSHAVTALLERLCSGRGSKRDIDRVQTLCTTIKGTTLCPTGEAFTTPIEAMVRKFRPEFEALVHDGGRDARG
jgi:NADH-quinone oxidoreductase E subunit